MEPVLIVTDTAHVDRAAVQSFDLDLAYGADEQDFEASFESPVLTGGELLYIDGTAYGGVVDIVETEANSTVSTYRGRTWHGILAGKIIAPDYDQDYVTVSGDANACIGAIIARVGLGSLMRARSAASGISVASYRFARFCNAYDGLAAMLAANGAKLLMERHDGYVEVWAERVETISDEADSDLLQFTLTANHRVPNHLVCAGEGELGERVRLDLYANAAGQVSTTQTLFGIDEIAVFYDHSTADLETLREDGTEVLQGFQVQGNVDTDIAGAGDWDVGDILVARDNRVGRTVSARIVKKIVRVARGALTTEYEVGLPTSTASRISSGGETTGAYAAGDGIDITDGTISATGVFSGAISALSAAITGAITAASAAISGALTASTVSTSGNYPFTFQSTDIDTAEADNGISANNSRYIRLLDKAGRYYAWLTGWAGTSGATQVKLTARNFGTGANRDNSLTLQVANDGTGTVELSHPSAWKDEIVPLTTTSLNLTTTSIGGGTKTIYFAKQGNIVIATFTGAMSPTAANTVYTIGTIPSGYRPARAAHASVRGKTNNIVSTASAAAKFVFNTGGSIQVRIGATGAYDYDFTVSWWTS